MAASTLISLSSSHSEDIGVSFSLGRIFSILKSPFNVSFPLLNLRRRQTSTAHKPHWQNAHEQTDWFSSHQDPQKMKTLRFQFLSFAERHADQLLRDALVAWLSYDAFYFPSFWK